ncbi:SCP1.201-like deaminase [Lentzea albidocapillata subsp. violacea]|uniref:SCP1.201-like deaminase n=1 Tax=Lentzea albidocapillata subsp. violacea TaxID=128104 RepID=A0A1G9I9T2_9PSEU|nr:DddA-like double-stranded DNA deaminase toxin [Lentzea albidocapillata]SDL21613.1 SCP1.201-like deaminase [Lentzea albidocapillata subsp. violacea]
MTSLGEVIAVVVQALNQVSNASLQLASAESLWIDAAEQLASALVGSEMTEAGELAQLDNLVRERFAVVSDELIGLAERLEGHLAQLSGDHSGSVKPALLQGVLARDGSRYPVDSGWCADLLPPRVIERTNRKTVGYVSGAPGKFVSGEDDTWTPEIVRRMHELGIGSLRSRRFLSAHVEMKVATMMVMQGLRRCDVTINHVPCRSGLRQSTGCHDVLRPYLPKGYTLVVHGTTQQGQPYSQTYEGQA